MKLNELLGVKKFANMTRDEVGAEAAKSGEWKKLGSGAHGHAFEHKGLVYKFWFKDDAYEIFIEFCKKHENCKWLPKFVSEVKSLPAKIAKASDAPEKIKYIKMEKLSKYRGVAIDIWKKPRNGRQALEMRSLLNLLNDVMKENNEAPSYEKFEHEILKYYYKKSPDERAGLTSFFRTYKIDHPDAIALLEMLVDLAKTCRANGVKFDIVEENLALRDRTPVILDPFMDNDSNEKSLTWKKFELILSMQSKEQRSQTSTK